MSAHKRLSLFVLPILGAALLWYATAPFRVGVSPDTLAFLNVAQHVQAGQGISAYYPLYSDQSHPLAAWPPLFPFLMWFGMPFGVHPLDTAWVVNLIFFAVNLWLAGWIVARATRSAAAGWAVQIIFVFYSLWRGFFIWGLSEPLFLIFVQIAILFLVKYLETGRNRDWRIAALSAGCCEITRYIGGLYIPALALALFLYASGRWSDRFKTAVRFFILGSVIPMVWAVRNYFRLSYLADSRSWADRVFGSLMHREESVNSLWYNVRSSMDACAAWIGDLLDYYISPGMNLWALALPFLAVAALAAVRPLRSGKEPKTEPTTAVLGLMACCYTVGLFSGLTFSLFSGGTPVRYLMPTATHVVMLIVVLLFRKTPQSGWNFRRAGQNLLCAGFVAWIVWSVPGTVRWVHETRSLGADDSKGGRAKWAKERSWFPTPELIQDYRRRKLYEEQSLGRSF